MLLFILFFCNTYIYTALKNELVYVKMNKL